MTEKRTCRECGQSEFALEPVYEYPWDGSDTEGSISELVGFRCVDRKACREWQQGQARFIGQTLYGTDDTYCRGTGQGYGQQQ